MNAIRLNPSQTLRLVKERDAFFERRGARRGDSENIFFTSPLILPFGEDFSRGDFLATKNFSIYKIQESASLFFFPCKIELRQNSISHIFPCAANLIEDTFNLQDFFLEAKTLAQKSNGIFFDETNFLFRATSFQFFRAEISRNSWNFFDAIWKKI